MTCASCSTTITKQLSEIQGLSEVKVDLLGNSMTLVASSEQQVKEVIEHVEDIGYECSIVDVKPQQQGMESKEPVELSRTVSIRIDGMFCQHCPEQVMATLETFRSNPAWDFQIKKPVGGPSDPILTISYIPHSPDFTIRSILTALSSASSPSGSGQPFVAAIHHPPSLESLSAKMQIKERQALLWRLIFTVILAIPTFIIGIVFTTLVHSTNSLRIYFNAPLSPNHTGSVSRMVWALFILATPVEFYSAGLFHRRSIKELRALWRRGSRTPILMRFIRFGSMNLLISLGVSVAYFSSIALLAIAATTPPSEANEGTTTTYFDSVVFLTMFLLIGRFLEAYSKSRTADAVSALGKLRPKKALLLTPGPSDLPATKEGRYAPSDSDLESGSTSSNVVDEKDISSYTNSVPVDLLELGDIIRVLPGSSPAADGVIVSTSHQPNAFAFDESSLTGESRPAHKNEGDMVYVGTICKGRPVDVEITKIGGETMLDQIVQVVRQGQTKRAPIERVADHLTAYFVPCVVFLSLITWIIWLVLGEANALPAGYLDIPIGGWPVWSLRFAIAVFVVACPCGIGLAAPTALLVGSGLAANFGILVRGGGEAFQEAANIDVVVFDKTGTLTRGDTPTVGEGDVVMTENDGPWKETTSLEMVYALESGSTHPVATAVTAYCKAQGISAADIEPSDVEEVAGRGIKGSFAGKYNADAVIGNEMWVRDHHAVIAPEHQETLESWKAQGKSVVLLALRSTQETSSTPESDRPFVLVAMFATSDPLREEAAEVVQRLQEDGIGTWMISGDNEVTAKAVAKTVGIPEHNVIAGVLPHEKAERVRWLQSTAMKRGRQGWRKTLFGERPGGRAVIAMCGDGINDAPALASADVSIAIGSGSDVAISSASFILVSSNLWSILTLTDLSRAVFRRIKFNFGWALMYNLAAVPIAAGVIYPAGHARLDPVWASLAMALSSVSVVTSSLLLKLYREPRELRGKA
ncbi:heavy metal translocatin [Sistotremastrum suecicum HHB10207 ss-3]|uniref:Heavy metal translocatin n=1 Tax=Sistotremastrum suecicum HHB10207 ss-3 TaxID=1314776 RepID=A0A166DAU0_9AGAM|nr:heavy metal translocatin [Sistotremastrum suecicum HHB10207 ss-3]